MSLYGDYVCAEEKDIPRCKELLLEQMIGTIRELAKEDKFWIIKHINQGDPTRMSGWPHCPITKPGMDVVVGWKIHFPQMDGGKGNV